MPLMKSWIRSEILNPQYLTEILTKIKALSTEKSSRVNFLYKGKLYKGSELASFTINPTLTNGTIVFDGMDAPKKASLILQDLTYTAQTAGFAGNGISIAYTGGAVAGAEVVTVVGNAISVQIQSGTSTATQVKAAVDVSVAAHALVAVAISGVAGHTQVAPVAPTNLAGGDNTGASNPQTFNKSNIVLIRRLRTRKYKIELM